jgi:hypothetical protein
MFLLLGWNHSLCWPVIIHILAKFTSFAAKDAKMNATYHSNKNQPVKGAKTGMTAQIKKITVPAFLVTLISIICIYSIAIHFIEKWDGHFYNTMGCTTIQNLHGRLYKLNSCENSVVPIEDVQTQPDTIQNDRPTKGFNNSLPDMNPPLTDKPLPQPLKKSPTPKDTAPAKESPYMI